MKRLLFVAMIAVVLLSPLPAHATLMTTDPNDTTLLGILYQMAQAVWLLF